MGNVTANLSRSEFLCRDECGLADPHPALVMGMQRCCDEAWRLLECKPVLNVTGPCRCHAHNEAVGGAPRSGHLPQANGYCLAADWMIEDLTLREVYGLALEVSEFKHGGIGVYLDDDGPRLHTDVRDRGPARWGKLNGKDVALEEVFKAQENTNTEE